MYDGYGVGTVDKKGSGQRRNEFMNKQMDGLWERNEEEEGREEEEEEPRREAGLSSPGQVLETES